MPKAALEGLRVVEIGRYVAAPYCARILSDLGADVAKFEGPESDPTRQWGPFRGDVPDPSQAGVFAALNAGKRTVPVDFDNPADLEMLHVLLEDTDVLIEGVEGSERDRWGLSFDELLERHPHLVVASLSPYGRSGPWSSRPGCDLTASAAASLPLGLGEPDRTPLNLPYDQCDHQAGLHAAAAVLAALHERRASGLGQGIDIATAQVTGYCVGGMHLVGAKMGAQWKRRGRLQRGTVYPTGFFECADGYVCIASQTPKQWKIFLELMGEPTWSDTEHARDALYLGGVDATPADAGFRTWLMTYTRHELLQLAMEHGIVLGEVHTVDEVLADDHLEHRDFWADLSIGDDKVRIPKAGYRFSETPTRVRPAELTAPRRAELSTSHRRAERGRSPDGLRLPALTGVRILDFGWNWAGPMAGQILADLGAEVIRVETRKRQDYMRFLDHTSYFFCHNNRSKMSVTVDVTKPDGAALVRRLAQHVDVVMDNFSAGVMAKNGLGYEELREVRPDIICVSMSMAGQTGPRRQMRGFASIATGFAGLESLVGYTDGTAEGLISFGLGDVTLAIQGVIGALAALEHRERTGVGQFVDVSQIDSATATLSEPLLDLQMNARLPAPRGNDHTGLSPHGIFAAAGENRWIAVAVRDTAEWSALASAIGRDDWAADHSFATVAGRCERAHEIHAEISAWCATRDRDKTADALAAIGVPAAPVLELPERNEHPQFTERGFRLAHDGGGFDPCLIYATPWLMTATPPKMTRPAPALGEQNEYVFKDVLGLTAAEYDELVDASVIA